MVRMHVQQLEVCSALLIGHKKLSLVITLMGKAPNLNSSREN